MLGACTSSRSIVCALLALAMATVCTAQTQNDVAKFNASGSTVNSSIYDNGNIGIGTTAPSAKLEVDSSGQGNVDVRLADAPTNSQFYFLPNASAGYGNPLVQAGDQVFGYSGNAIDSGNLDIVPWSASSKGIRITSSGNIGIGTASPHTGLEVLNPSVASANGQEVLRLSSLTNGSTVGSGPFLRFDNSLGTEVSRIAARTESASYVGMSLFTYNNGSSLEALRISGQGNVGIGTTTPSQKLEVNGWAQVDGTIVANGGALQASGTLSSQNSGTDTQVFWWADNRIAYMEAHNFSNNTKLPIALNAWGGNVGIGTTQPGAKLEVNGSVKLSVGSGGGVVFPDSTNQTTAWTGVLCGGDYAESVGVSGKRAQYEPGDVIVIDRSNPETFIRSSTPYSKTVAGIYSTKPGAIGRRSTNPETIKVEIPMAMVGIVPTKVSAENGPIEPGDVLVTSATPGYAMRGTDGARLVGAIVGKALQSLNHGNGVIDVLVTLQ